MTLYVNGEKVDDQSIANEAEKLRPQYEQVFADMPPEERQKQLMDWSRENVVEGVLLRQAAAKDRDKVSQEEIDNTYRHLTEQNGGKEQFFRQMGLPLDQEDKVKADIADRLCLEKLIDRITRKATKPSEKDIRRYYEKNADRFTIPEMVRAAHIIKHLKPIDDADRIVDQMNAIRAQIDDGTDFAQLAQQHSECPENGGDLGFFARGQMVQNFEDIVFNMPVGDVSDVFQTEFGFHIAKVLDRKSSVPCPIEDVRQVIERELAEQSHQTAIENFVDAEKEKATIEDR